MAYCCHGWERGLPFLSIRALYDELAELDQRTTQRYKDFVGLANVIITDLKQEAASLPSQLLVKKMSTNTDKKEEKESVSVECQSAPTGHVTVMVAPATTDVVISITEE